MGKMNTTDELAMQGQLHLTRRQIKGGAEVQSLTATNHIVLSGRDLIARLFALGELKPIAYLAVGTGDRAVAAEDTALVEPVAQVALKPIDIVQDLREISQGEGADPRKRQQLLLAAELGADAANDTTLTEAALFNADGIMYNRVVFAPVPKTADFTITFRWELIF